MPNLIFVRHGQASFGAENYDCLSELGERQASAVGGHFLRSKLAPDRVISGDLERQKNTAALALEKMTCSIEPEIIPAFNEYDSDGVFKNYMPAVLNQFPSIRDNMTPEDYGILKQRDVFKKLFFPIMNQWIDAAPANAQPMETWQDFRHRVVTGIDNVVEKSDPRENVVVFTSGGVIAMAMTHLLGLDAKSWAGFNWRTPNASVTRFVGAKSGIALESYNRYGHLLNPELDLKVTYL